MTCAHFLTYQALVSTLVLFNHLHAPCSYTCVVRPNNSNRCRDCSVVQNKSFTCRHWYHPQDARPFPHQSGTCTQPRAVHTHPVHATSKPHFHFPTFTYLCFPRMRCVSSPHIYTHPLFFMQLVKSSTRTHLPNSDVHTYPRTRHTHPERTACFSQITTCVLIRHAFTASPRRASCLLHAELLFIM